MKKNFKTTIVILFLLILFGLPILFAPSFGQSYFIGFLISLSLLSLVLVVLLVRAVWQRWREKKFINGLLEEDSKVSAETDKELAGELSRHWKEAMGGLKKSNLKNLGNPLYVLPWYMLIGEHGSGKTTALKNSGLTSKFASPPQAAGLDGTRNCDWWYFEQSIIIDTAGRYALHQDDAADREEWRLFLAQLARYRKKEPLNGLIISVSADRLLTAGPDEILAEGKSIRTRIEELMQSLGAKIPVYVLITKGDLIYGMKDFSDTLPEDSHGQAFGYLNPDLSGDVQTVVDRMFESLKSKAGEYRLRMANRPGEESLSPEVILFPEEFAQLKKGLSGFIEGAFNKSVYQEQPILRGIYFTSAKQSGEPLSHYLSDSGIDIDKTREPSEKSYFLYDFFAKILPADRNLFTLTRRAREWKTKIRAMKLSAWALSIFVLCGFLSWSFGTNLIAIKEFERDFRTPPVFSGELLKDINTLEKLKTTVLAVESRNSKTWLPGFGLNYSKAIERDIKEAFCHFFREDFIQFHDKRMTEAVIGYDAGTPPEILARTIPHYIRRINILEASLDVEGVPVLSPEKLPDFKVLVLKPGERAIPKSIEMLESQYLHYLSWSKRQDRVKEIGRLRERLDFIAAKKELSLNWLVAWCNTETESEPITLKTFWTGKNPPENGPVIMPAYTVKGFEMIEGMIRDLEQAMETPLKIEKKKILFQKWYRSGYEDVWFQFGADFNKGIECFADDRERLMTIKQIGAKRGPYFSLLERMAEELSPCLEREGAIPVWIDKVYAFAGARAYASKSEAADKKGFVGSIAKKGMRLLGKAGRIAGGASAEASSGQPEQLMVSADNYRKYVEALSGMSDSGVSSAAAYKLAVTVFAEDPATGASSVNVARRSLDDLVISIQNTAVPEKMVTGLLGGSFEFVWDEICRKTGYRIQELWDEKVLAPVDGVYDAKVLSGMLFGKGGYVKQFTSKEIAPFISRSRRKGYYAKTVAGQSIPFEKSFFKYMTRGAYSVQSEKAEYKVTLKGIPTDTNAEATLIPHVTKLELECAQGAQALENYNFPVSKTFIWSPGECGDVTLKIHVGDLVLEKKYTGFRPFARFLKDFSSGKHTFYAKEFRGKRSELKRMGIKYIKVKYKISGGGPVIRLLNMAAGNAPGVIVNWSD